MSSLAAVVIASPGIDGRRRAAAVATVLAAMAAAVLDAGMINVALPRMAAAFAIPAAQTILVVTTYQGALVMALLPLGAFGERYGHRRVFTWSVAVFALGSAFAALAPSLSWLLVARGVQGLGSAGVMALGVALLRFTVPAGQLGRAIGWNALNVALASGAAPAVGALLMALTGWRGLFAFDLPIAVLALAGARALPASPRTAAPLDGISMGLTAATLGMAIGAAQIGVERPVAAAILVTLALSALTFLVRREGPKASPLFPVDLLRRRPVRLSAMASVCCFAAQSSGLVMLSFALQHQLGLPSLLAGLCLTAWPASVAVAAALCARVADRVAPSRLCALGAGGLAAGLGGCGLAGGLLTMLSAIVVAGLGFGFFQTPNNHNLFLSAPEHRGGAAGGLQGVARVTGQTSGALIVALLITHAEVPSAAPVVFAIAAVLASGAAILSLLQVLA